MEDEQDRNATTKERNAELLTQFRADPDRPGLAALGESVYRMLIDPERRARYFADFYDYAVERCLDGVTCRLTSR